MICSQERRVLDLLKRVIVRVIEGVLSAGFYRRLRTVLWLKFKKMLATSETWGFFGQDCDHFFYILMSFLDATTHL